MRRHPNGFDYLPMLMKEDAAWNAADPWNRPRPQTAQWALSHAIYPGLVFDRDDPVVRGHIALMQACDQRRRAGGNGLAAARQPVDLQCAIRVARVSVGGRKRLGGAHLHRVPQPCVAALLLARRAALARRLVSGYWGDMPHNWASAECILYLRHMYALEDGPRLRLLAGVTAADEAELRQTPTRFGRVDLKLSRRQAGGWRLEFARAAGQAPAGIELPASLGGSHVIRRSRWREVRAARSIDIGRSVRIGVHRRLEGVTCSARFSLHWSVAICALQAKTLAQLRPRS